MLVFILFKKRDPGRLASGHVTLLVSHLITNRIETSNILNIGFTAKSQRTFN